MEKARFSFYSHNKSGTGREDNMQKIFSVNFIKKYEEEVVLGVSGE
jgi:hypothetical protein